MTTIRSSVNPDSSKQKWGTILKPNFGLGYQKMNSYEIDQTVDRLAKPVEKRERVFDRPQQADLKPDEIGDMVRKSFHSSDVNKMATSGDLFRCHVCRKSTNRK